MSRRAAYALIAAGALSAVAIAALLVLRGAVFTEDAAPAPAAGFYRGSEPPPGIQLPRFTLRDIANGNRVFSQSLQGRAVLVTFLDTDCTQQCPIIAGQIGRALQRLEPPDRQRVTAIAISVNPQRDTRLSAIRFLRQHHVLGRLSFLGGDIPALRPVWRAFHIVSAHETGNADLHSADVRVFDPKGVWVATLHVGVDLTPENLAHDLLTALKNAA